MFCMLSGLSTLSTMSMQFHWLIDPLSRFQILFFFFGTDLAHPDG